MLQERAAKTRLGRRSLMRAGVAAALAAVMAPHGAHAAAALRAACVRTSFQSLDPGKVTSAPDFWVLWAMFNGLAKFDADHPPIWWTLVTAYAVAAICSLLAGVI